MPRLRKISSEVSVIRNAASNGSMRIHRRLLPPKATKMAYGEAMFVGPDRRILSLVNKIMIFIAAIGTIAAPVTTCVAANVVAPKWILQPAPKKISYKKGVIITIIAFFHPAGMVDLRSLALHTSLDERLRYHPRLIAAHR